MATNTNVGLEYIAIFVYSGYTNLLINKIRIGSSKTAEATTDTDLASKYTDHGFEEATASTIEYFLGTTAHPYTIHLQKVFTNNDPADRAVWECGAFSSDGVCVCRHVFQPYELMNNNVVPVGQTATIDIYINFIGGESSVDPGVINPSNFACEHGKICFNNYVLPNASPPEVTEGRGGKTWKIKCYSEDYAKILALIANQGLVQTGVSVTGYQYATSLQRYGALKIWSKTTHAHVTYLNCLLIGPVQVSPFGLGWWFDLTIVQSYYGDMV